MPDHIIIVRVMLDAGTIADARGIAEDVEHYVNEALTDNSIHDADVQLAVNVAP